MANTINPPNFEPAHVRWTNVCKNKNWSDEDIRSFFHKGLYQTNVTYVVGDNVLMAQTKTRDEAIKYETWNLDKTISLRVNILHLY